MPNKSDSVLRKTTFEQNGAPVRNIYPCYVQEYIYIYIYLKTNNVPFVIYKGRLYSCKHFFCVLFVQSSSRLSGIFNRNSFLFILFFHGKCAERNNFDMYLYELHGLIVTNTRAIQTAECNIPSRCETQNA